MGIYRKAHLLGSFCTARGKGESGDPGSDISKEYAEMAAEALGGFAFREGDCRVAGCPESLPLRGSAGRLSIWERFWKKKRPKARKRLPVFPGLSMRRYEPDVS